MAHFKLHAKFNILVILPIFLVISYVYLSKEVFSLALFSLSFVYATIFAHPDMDMANQVKLFSFYGLMTLPYKLFYAPFFKHRGKISHSLVWGTPSRLFALFVFLLLVMFLVLSVERIIVSSLDQKELENIFYEIFSILLYSSFDLFKLVTNNLQEFLFMIFGFYLADLGHVFLDKLGR